MKKDTLELPNVEIDIILKSKIRTVLGGPRLLVTYI